MKDYIYTYRDQYGVETYEVLIFVKETKTQIVAHRIKDTEVIFRFNKETGELKGVGKWGSSIRIITKEAFRVGRNRLIDQKIEKKEKEMSKIQSRIEELRKRRVL